MPSNGPIVPLKAPDRAGLGQKGERPGYEPVELQVVPDFASPAYGETVASA